MQTQVSTCTALPSGFTSFSSWSFPELLLLNLARKELVVVLLGLSAST